MGRHDRERKGRIVQGLEAPLVTTVARTLGSQFRHYKKCGITVSETVARRHIKECWGIDWPENEPIPDYVPS